MYSSFEAANLAANARSTNQLSGDINEFIAQPSVINLYAISSAANIHVTMFADSDVAIDNKEVISLGTSLAKSDHLLDSFIVGAGTRLALFLDERGGVATTDVLLGVEVLPV